MAKKDVGINVEINMQTNLPKVTEELTDVQKEAQAYANKLKELTKDSSELSKEQNNLGIQLEQTSGITNTLDKVSGGLYSQMKEGISAIRKLIIDTVAYNKVQKASATATDSTSKSVKGLRDSFVSSGIGAIIVLVGMAVQQFMELTEAINAGREGTDLLTIANENLKQSFVDVAADAEYNHNLNNEMLRRRGASEAEFHQEYVRYSREKFDLLTEEIEQVEKLQQLFGLSSDKYAELTLRISSLSKQRSRTYNNMLLSNERFETDSILRIQKQREEANKKFIEDAKKTEKAIADARYKINTEYTVSIEHHLQSRRTKLQKEYDDAIDMVLLIPDDKEREEGLNKLELYFNEQYNLVEEERIRYNDLVKSFGIDVTDIFDDVEKLADAQGFIFARLDTKEMLEGNVEEFDKMFQGFENIIENKKDFIILRELLVERSKIWNDYSIELESISEATTEKQVEINKAGLVEQMENELDAQLHKMEQLYANEEEMNRVRQYYINERTKLEEEASDKIIDIKQKEADAEKAIDEEKFNNAKTIANGIAGLTDALASSSKEGSSLQKGFAIATVMIDTAVGAVEMFTGVSKALGNTPWSIPVATAAASGVAINGLNAINKIKRVKTDGSEKGGGGGGGAQMIAPNVQFVSSSENQIANTINDTNEAMNMQETPPIKTYVVTSDVETGLELDRNAVNRSSL